MTWLSTYQKGWLRFDLVAGLTTAAVVIPKAMAFAAIAGLPLVVGLYTSLVPLVVYAVVGTSRPLSVTSTSTIAILAASALGQVAPGGDAASLVSASATLALLTGAFLLLGGLLMLRPEGGIYFANAPRLGQKISALLNEYTPKVLVLDLSAVPDLEFTALRMLTDSEEKLREAGTTLWLAALNPEVLRVVQHSPLWAQLGRARMFFNLEQAVERYQREGGGTISETEKGAAS